MIDSFENKKILDLNFYIYLSLKMDKKTKANKAQEEEEEKYFPLFC
jgi:hypothetical protein